MILLKVVEINFFIHLNIEMYRIKNLQNRKKKGNYFNDYTRFYEI